MSLPLSVFQNHPRSAEDTVWVELLIHNGGWAYKDKHRALPCSVQKRRTLVISFMKGDQNSGLMCKQAWQGSKGFWATWTPGVHRWKRVDWACGTGDWHGSDQLCVISSCLSGLIAERSVQPYLRPDRYTIYKKSNFLLWLLSLTIAAPIRIFF